MVVGRGGDAGVVDEDVEVAESGFDEVGAGGDGVVGCDVKLDCLDGAREALGLLGRLFAFCEASGSEKDVVVLVLCC